MRKDIYIPYTGRINLIKIDDCVLSHLPRHMRNGGVDETIVREIEGEIKIIRRTSPSREYIHN